MAAIAIKQEPEAPARVTGDHAQDRVLSTRAGAQTGWQRLTIYEKEFRKGNLCCKSRCTNPAATQEEVRRALTRRDAAKEFDEGWILCNAAWPAGSDMNRVRVAGHAGSFVDFQRGTKDFWRKVQLNMGTNDWIICRRVCGEGYKVAETVIAIQPGYRDSTLARFREALDSLNEAIERVRR